MYCLPDIIGWMFHSMVLIKSVKLVCRFLLYIILFHTLDIGLNGLLSSGFFKMKWPCVLDEIWYDVTLCFI